MGEQVVLTDKEVEEILDALAAVINLDTESQAFASVVRATYPDSTCGSDLRRRYAAALKPKLAEYHRHASNHLNAMSRALAGARVH